jgi:immune inhibitor A
MAGLAIGAARPARATIPTPSGWIPPEVAQGFLQDFRTLVARSPERSTITTQAVWRIPVVMVSFSDLPLTHAPAEFEFALFDTTGATGTGSVYDYYQWASGGQIKVVGQVVATVHFADTLGYYGNGSWGLAKAATPRNIYGAVFDALQACQRSVDWSQFDLDQDGIVDMLWLLHAGVGGEGSASRQSLWSINSSMSGGGWQNGRAYPTSQVIPGTGGLVYRLDRFSTLPEISTFHPGQRSEIGVYCHEFGHALGLPDLYDTSNLSSVSNVGPGCWSLMASGVYGGDGFSPQYPTHPGGWASVFLGWSTSIRPTEDTTVVIAPLVRGGPVVDFWFQGEANPEHFLLENRQREGFDRNLPNSGLLISHVEDGVITQRLPGNNVNVGPIPGLQVVEGDGDFDLYVGRNHGDANDPFPGATGRTEISDETTPGTRSFSGGMTNIALSQIGPVGSDMRVHLQVRAPGWLSASDRTIGEFAPIASSTSARRSVLQPDGSIDIVRSEERAGVPQIIVRSRQGSVWMPPIQLSSSPEAALDPALAAVPGGGVAVVWSDTRGGYASIRYRSRVRGAWSDERVLANLPGDSRAPAIGVDASGRVQVAWLNVLSGIPRLYFTRFLYFAPFGQPVPLTSTTEWPGNPALAVTNDGMGYILWPDATSAPQRYWFSRFRPDSGITSRLPLTPTPGYQQTALNALADSAGTLHVIWHVSGPGVSEIHYQRRFRSTRPEPRDTTLESRDSPISEPGIAIEPAGSLHLAFEATAVGGQQVYYKRWRPAWGWDFRSTEVSSALDGSASSPMVLPSSPGNVTVLYVANPDQQYHFMERRRQLDGAVPLAAEPPAPQEGLGSLSLGPNPLPPGAALELRWSGAAPLAGAVIEIFDLAGRRVGAVPLEARSDAWSGRLPPTITSRWASGVYFARLKGERAATRLVLLR